MVHKLRTSVLIVFIALIAAAGIAPVFSYLSDTSTTVYAQDSPQPEPSEQAQQPPQDSEATPGSNSDGNEANTSDENIDNFDDSCRTDVGVLSWILCPIADMTNGIIEFAANFILSALETAPLVTDTSETNLIYTAWGVFRSLANVLLIIAFIILIYMQLIGSNAYQIQKTLPRLVVVAVMIQVSYFIAAFIVDIGNVLAAGVGGIFDQVNAQILNEELINQLQQGASSDAMQLRDSGYSAAEAAGVGSVWLLFGSIGAFTLIFSTGFSFGALLLILLGVMIAALFALMALALRQLLIVIFVVLAPVAFIMGVFPQTDKWMREWFDNFIKVILIYPLVALVFGVSSTLSLLALETKGRDFNQLLMALLPLIALASVPLMFRFAGGIFRAVSGGMRGIAQKTAHAVKGDPKNPYSMSGRVAYQRHLNRGKAAIYTTDKILPRIPGAGSGKYHPANSLARKINKTTAAREAYRQGQERSAGRLSTVFKDPIHGLFFGNQAVKGWRGALNYEPNKNSLLFRYGEGRDFRQDRTLYAGALEPAAKLAAGGHPDYATAFMHGNLMNDLVGEVHPEIAQEFDEEFISAAKGKHMYIKGAKYEYRKAIQEAAHENTGGYLDNREMIDTMYLKPMNEIPQWAVEPVMKIRTGVFDDMEGGLNEQQSANTFETMQAFIDDDNPSGTLDRYLRPDGLNIDDAHADKLVGVYKKMQGMVMPTRDQLEAATGAYPDAESPAEAISSTYKSPADIKSQERFVRTRSALRDFLDRNNIDYS